MTSFEYGDCYKFLVSLGVGLVGIAIGVPWLFLHEGSDLLVDSVRLKALTPVAQSVILARQSILQEVLRIIPWASLLCLVTGIVLVVVGTIRWRARQKILDQKDQLEVTKLQFELKEMTPQETESKIQAEAEPELAYDKPAESSLLDKYRAIEWGGPLG